MSATPQNWDAEDVKGRIGPYVETLAAEWGIRLTGRKNAKGWLECQAIDRDDDRPSAAINARTGAYKDLATGGKALSIFDLAVRLGGFQDFPAAVNGLGERFGVPPTKVGNGITPVRHAKAATSGRAPTPKAAGPKAPKPAKVATGYRTFLDAVGKTAWSIKGELVNYWMYNATFGIARLKYEDKGKQKKTYRPYNYQECGWVCGDPPGPLPLYRSREIPPDGPVFVLEGEKVVEIARGLGLPAVTSSHGSGSAAKSDWSPLAGREVVIIPDGGDAGMAYATEVSKLLAGLSPRPTVRVMSLPDLGPKDDLEQWLERAPDLWTNEQCGTEIRRLAQKAGMVGDASGDPLETKGAAPGKSADAVPGRLGTVGESSNAADGLPTDEELGLICLDDVEEEEITWLWEGRWALGKITLLAGEGEIGKTFLTLDVIARLTTGRALPGCTMAAEPCGCVFVTAEDGLGDTIKPRLRKMGGDPKRVWSIGTATLSNGHLAPFTIADIARLDAIMAKQPGIRLIVIDPISSFLGRVDENKNAELRALLAPLSDFADRHKVAIIPITHFGKAPTTKATAKILGSVAYSNAARASYCVLRDPEDSGRRLLLHAKNNLSPLRSGLAYRITSEGLAWDSYPVNKTADEVLAESTPRKSQARAETVIEAIRLALADGPLTKDEVCRRAKASHDVGKNAVWEHKEAAGVTSFKSSFDGGWRWRLSLPPNHPQPSPTVPNHPQPSPTIPDQDGESFEGVPSKEARNIIGG